MLTGQDNLDLDLNASSPYLKRKFGSITCFWDILKQKLKELVET